MNKQRYLTELRRLLVFMTDEDREEAVRRCEAAFDAAGSEGEADLIAVLGSPTKAAIGLSRGYEPGQIPDVFPKAAVKPVPQPAAEPLEIPQGEGDSLLPAEPEITWTDLPDFELPGIGAAEPAVPAAPAEPEEPAAPAEPAVPAEPKEPEEPKAPKEPEAAEVVTERSMPLGLGIPLFVLVIAALGVPLAALCLAVCALLLAPGCAVIFGAYLVFVGGLWCLSYMADAVLLFGLAFVMLAVGLFVLWGGLWLAIRLIGAYVSGVRWLAGELLGRKVTLDE